MQLPQVFVLIDWYLIPIEVGDDDDDEGGDDDDEDDEDEGDGDSDDADDEEDLRIWLRLVEHDLG